MMPRQEGGLAGGEWAGGGWGGEGRDYQTQDGDVMEFRFTAPR